MLKNDAFHRKPLKDLPCSETLVKAEEFLQSELGQKMAREKQEKEEAKERFNNLLHSVSENAQRREAEKIVREQAGLALQEEANIESKKQTELAEKSLSRANWGLSIGIAGTIIAVAALVLSILSFTSR